VEIKQRLAAVLDSRCGSDREDDAEPAAVTRGRGIHFKGSRDDD
jgi:hypothetical protein